MEAAHVKALVESMNGNGPRSKSASALFFHAHVVCITKMATTGGEVWYDIIDSLPRKVEPGRPPNGVRIRCKDAEALEACVRWYASSKFGASDCEYCDGNSWDEDNCDFDPRVFQSFTWGEVDKDEKK